MRKLIFIMLFVLGGNIGSVVAESMDFPSVSAEKGHIFISNNAGSPVTFYLTGGDGQQHEYMLSAHNSGTYQLVPPSNDGMDIAITTQGNKIVKRLNAGERYYIDANQQGFFDVFVTQPSQ